MMVTNSSYQVFHSRQVVFMRIIKPRLAKASGSTVLIDQTSCLIIPWSLFVMICPGKCRLLVARGACQVGILLQRLSLSVVSIYESSCVIMAYSSLVMVGPRVWWLQVAAGKLSGLAAGMLSEMAGQLMQPGSGAQLSAAADDGKPCSGIDMPSFRCTCGGGGIEVQYANSISAGSWE